VNAPEVAPPFGRTVLYVIDEHAVGDDGVEPVIRPAIAVRAWGDGADRRANLTVFLDGENDEAYGRGPTIWVTNRAFSSTPKVGTWHWPPLAAAAHAEAAVTDLAPANDVVSTLQEAL